MTLVIPPPTKSNLKPWYYYKFKYMNRVIPSLFRYTHNWKSIKCKEIIKVIIIYKLSTPKLTPTVNDLNMLLALITYKKLSIMQKCSNIGGFIRNHTPKYEAHLLITRRSLVQVLPPQPKNSSDLFRGYFFTSSLFTLHSSLFSLHRGIFLEVISNSE